MEANTDFTAVSTAELEHYVSSYWKQGHSEEEHKIVKKEAGD